MGKDKKGTPYQEIDINRLKRNPNNPRGFVSVESVSDLSNSIRRVGLLQPIVVRPDFQIIAGERRYVAAMSAGLKTVPVVVRETENNDEIFDIAFIENIHRENLSPIAEGEIYAALVKNGQSLRKIAERFSVGESKISTLTRLLSLPEFIQEAIHEDKISVTGGRYLCQIEDKELQKEIALEAIRTNMSADEIKTAKERNGTKPKPKTPLRAYADDINWALDKLEMVRVILGKFPEYKEDVRELAGIKVGLRKIQEKILSVETDVIDKMIKVQKGKK